MLRMLLNVIETMIDRYPIQPGLEGRFAPERWKMLEGLDEDVLRQVHRIITIFHEPVADAVNLAFVSNHDLVESCRIPAKVSFDKFDIRIRTTGCHWE